MTRQTAVSIANAHDRVALSERQSADLADLLWWLSEHPSTTFARAHVLRRVANILRGKRRDGSEPGDAA